MDFLTWTYFYRRLTRNPAYYHLADGSPEAVGGYLSDIVESTLADLENAGCVEVGSDHDQDAVAPTTLGRVSSYYYLKVPNPNPNPNPNPSPNPNPNPYPYLVLLPPVHERRPLPRRAA